MRRILFVMLACATISISLPLLIVSIMGGFADNTKGDDMLIDVYFHAENTTKKINLGEYLTGVVAAEMNAVFNEEALKAQSVAARTYTLHKLSQKKDDLHKDAPICTDSKHCQAWIDINKKIDDWGPDADANSEKIKRAVTSTANEVIVYNGELISALFHSTSSGYTENASDVWGKEVPYLVSVKSDGEDASPRYTSTLSLSIDNFKKVAKESIDDIEFGETLFSDIVRSDAGGIKSIKLGNKEISGIELRKIYNLRSTNAQITNDEKTVTFSVKGNGHGVGMSQYGANHLAAAGYNYIDILTHYYSGVEITSINQDNAL